MMAQLNAAERRSLFKAETLFPIYLKTLNKSSLETQKDFAVAVVFVMLQVLVALYSTLQGYLK